jgi:hypothetical protein
MNRSAKADSIAAQQSAVIPDPPAERLIQKRSKKRAQNSRKVVSSRSKVPFPSKKSDRVSGIRETEEARALLEEQLNSLYWWVFNAFKMKGFIRAKALHELQRAGAGASKAPTEQQDLAEAYISPASKRPNK